MPSSEPCERTPLHPTFTLHTDGKEYFADGDLYVNSFSSEDQDHPWELSEIVREIRYILGSDKYVN